jgi:CRISPR system Cascade subunit CasA
VSLQTQEGFLGAGNYGVSRMNGGFASRPGLGVAPRGGPGRRLVRDAERLADLRARLLDDYAMYRDSGGNALVWLLPWNGNAPLHPKSLDVLYIDICRRVRMLHSPTGQLTAYGTTTASARVDAKALKGNTGDPWTPLMPDAGGYKALTVDRGSFGYKRLVPLLLGGGDESPRRALLQLVAPTDDAIGLRVVARGLVRGQGQTDGLLEREIPISRSLRSLLVERPTDRDAAVALERVEDASTFARRVLFPAILQVYTGAPREGERARDDDTAKKRTNRVLAVFDHRIDQSFFADLSAELDVANDVDAARAIRAHWLLRLKAMGHLLVSRTASSAPSAAMRSFRVRARALDVLAHAFQRQFGQRVTDALPGRSASMPDVHPRSANAAP